MYGTCRQSRKLGTGGLSYLSRIIFLAKRKRWGVSNQRLLALEPSPYPPASDPLRHQEGQGQSTIFSVPACPCVSLLPFPLSCHVVSSLCFSMHWLYFPLSAFVHLFLPSVPKSWIQEPAQADDCSGKYRVPKTRSSWPSLGHVAVPGLIYECSRAAGCAPHPHREGKQCSGWGVG